MKKTETFFSHGKLIISGEYFVLDGALSFSLPTKFGQSLEVFTSEKNITWQGFDNNKNIWIELVLDNNLNIISNNGGDSHILQKILKEAININHDFLEKLQNKLIKTYLDFPLNWGLGSSSTLINNISMWANISPFLLLEKTIGGSGYDIATAQRETPTLFKLINNLPIIQGTLFDIDFKENLFFIYLGKKKNSKDEIKRYSQIKKEKNGIITKINKLTYYLVETEKLSDFENIIDELENLTSIFLGEKTIKETLFPDFKGSIKNLGAWGGDFILATGKSDYVHNYFFEKKLLTLLPYNEIIL